MQIVRDAQPKAGAVTILDPARLDDAALLAVCREAAVRDLRDPVQTAAGTAFVWGTDAQKNVVVTDFSTQMTVVGDCEDAFRDGAATLRDALTAYAAWAARAEQAALDGIRATVAALEAGLLAGKQDRRVPLELVRCRRAILALRKRCEGLCNLLAPEPAADARARYERLCDGARECGEYLTQVRDAYQSCIEQKQNALMRAFTVITAIFMPLQLVTGWYGMNLVMPEARLPQTYPIVCGVCVAIVVFCLVLFRKKRWL